MNGLANAILTMLLSWLRFIVNRVWSIVNSETGSRFFTFLAENWLMILLVLGVGGFFLDKIIYLIRWRPFSVRRRRRERQAMEAAYQDEQPWLVQQPDNPYMRPQAQVSAPADDPAYAAPAQEDFHFDQNLRPSWNEPGYEAIANAPTVAGHPAVDHSAYRPPMEDIEPVFDEQALWAGGDALVNQPAYEQTHVYAGPVSAQYQQDVNAGFARPVPPEQLYAPPPQAFAPAEPAAGEPVEAQPVHPGLDAEMFRRSMGLANGEEAEMQANRESPVSVSFTPFTQKTEAEQPAKKNRNPFLSLMRLVDDEAAKPSIRDLQSNVDIRDAFREPVYPKPLYRNEDDPS